MDIKKQICSHEQAMTLKKLGLTQLSLFYYVNNWRNPKFEPVSDGEYIISGDQKHFTNVRGRERQTEVEFVSAYNVAELGELLPYEDLSYGMVLRQNFPDGKEQSEYQIEYAQVYSDLDYGPTVLESIDDTEAKSRAGLLIHLIKNKFVDVNQINDAYNPPITDDMIF